MADNRKQQILDAYQFRHACKEFDPTKKIPDEDFQFLLECGRLSPSSFGFEPWKFVVLQNPEIRAKIAPIAWGSPKKLETSSHYVLYLARKKPSLLPDSDYITHIMKDVHQMPDEVVGTLRKFYRTFLESDFKIIDNDRAIFDWACRQTYIALGNMMTAAAEIGIDSCPIEGFDQEKVEAVLREAGILQGDEFGLAVMCAFGYRAVDPHRAKSRQSMADVVEWV